MVKSKTQFVCQNCSSSYSKWSGRCENCGQWNSLVEQLVESGSNSTSGKASQSGKALKIQPISQIDAKQLGDRLSTSFKDLDQVLGGGILAGSITLLAGEPGIGKSTLSLQVSAQVANSDSVLYISGEESTSQIRLRADRLGAKSDKLSLASTNSTNDIVKTILSRGFSLVVIDSIQTISLNELTSAPGTVSQITGSANAIINAAKATGTAVILVGHVTKQGNIAGPKILEHLVDVVLQFEGDRYGGFKLIRAIKNRFGSTNEVAIFEMDETGLKIVKNPSAELLAERQNLDGSIVLATIEGNRSLLVEIQALVNSTNYGYPSRMASGFDLNRLNLLIAVLQKRTKLNLSNKDVYVNVVGGLKLNDRAADLAICMAIASAATGRKIDDDTVVYGEVGLAGEIRSAQMSDKRIAEAKKMGFNRAIAPGKSPKSSFVAVAKDLRTVLIKYLNQKG